MFRLAELHQLKLEATVLIEDPDKAMAKVVAIHGQMTAIEDRHGLSPKSLLGLRWLIDADEVEAADEPTAVEDEIAKQREKSRLAAAGG